MLAGGRNFKFCSIKSMCNAHTPVLNKLLLLRVLSYMYLLLKTIYNTKLRLERIVVDTRWILVTFILNFT